MTDLSKHNKIVAYAIRICNGLKNYILINYDRSSTFLDITHIKRNIKMEIKKKLFIKKKLIRVSELHYPRLRLFYSLTFFSSPKFITLPCLMILQKIQYLTKLYYLLLLLFFIWCNGCQTFYVKQKRNTL